MDNTKDKAKSTQLRKPTAKAEKNTMMGSYASGVDSPNATAGGSGCSAMGQQCRDFDDSRPEHRQVSLFEMARWLLQRFVSAMLGYQQQGTPGVNNPNDAPPTQRITDFKFPEETKGKDVYRNEFTNVKAEEYKPCDRETVLFDSNEASTSKAIAEEPTDDFFEVTAADVKSLYKDRVRQVTSEWTLMTKSMRQMALDETHQKYQRVVVRIQFPDGLVLQGCFRPREIVYALHKFVKEHLEDKEQEFHLYRTPPKQVLTDMTKTLMQADLAPASLVYFGSEYSADHSLSDSARSEISSKRIADELSVQKLARKGMEQLATGSAENPRVTSSCNNIGACAARNAASSYSRSLAKKTTAGAASSEAKVPKWFLTRNK